MIYPNYDLTHSIILVSYRFYQTMRRKKSYTNFLNYDLIWYRLKNKKILVLLSLTLLSFSISNTDKRPAYAEFDQSGNYVCNPFERSLETNIYIDTVSKINYKMELYSKTNPIATPQEQHDMILQDQKTWDLYFKSRACISSIGINPDNIATLDASVQQAIAVPEFPFASLALIAAIVPIILISRMRY